MVRSQRFRRGTTHASKPSHDSERCANLLRTTIGILDGQRPPKGDRTKALIGRVGTVGQEQAVPETKQSTPEH